MRIKPMVGQHVKLNKRGYEKRLIASEDDVKAAQDMIIKAVEKSDQPGVWLIDVSGTLNRYMLNNQLVDPIEPNGNNQQAAMQ